MDGQGSGKAHQLRYRPADRPQTEAHGRTRRSAGANGTARESGSGSKTPSTAAGMRPHREVVGLPARTAGARTAGNHKDFGRHGIDQRRTRREPGWPYRDCRTEASARDGRDGLKRLRFTFNGPTDGPAHGEPRNTGGAGRPRKGQDVFGPVVARRPALCFGCARGPAAQDPDRSRAGVASLPSCPGPFPARNEGLHSSRDLRPPPSPPAPCPPAPAPSRSASGRCCASHRS